MSYEAKSHVEQHIEIGSLSSTYALK